MSEVIHICVLVFTSLILIALIPANLFSQQQEDIYTLSAKTERVAVIFYAVDLFGNPVRDLSKDEIALFEGKKPCAIDSLELIDHAATTPSRYSALPPESRLLFLQFDLARPGLAPGDYRLRISLTDTATGGSDICELPFHIPDTKGSKKGSVLEF